jgi:hypothetical protein
MVEAEFLGSLPIQFAQLLDPVILWTRLSSFPASNLPVGNGKAFILRRHQLRQLSGDEWT